MATASFVKVIRWHLSLKNNGKYKANNDHFGTPTPKCDLAMFF